MSSASETNEEPPMEPVNPRRAPDVVRALKRAAKSDPHRDVLKPIGRGCFLISLVVIGWLARPLTQSPSANLHVQSNAPLTVLARSGAVIEHVTKGVLAIDPRKALHFDLEPKQASMLMLGGLFGFGFYYFAVYLVAMNAVRVSFGVGAVADASIRRARKIASRLRKPKDDEGAPVEMPGREVPQAGKVSS